MAKGGGAGAAGAESVPPRRRARYVGSAAGAAFRCGSTSGERPIERDGLVAAKAALYRALAEAGLSKSELARRLGCDEKEVRRLLDPRHRSRFDRLEAALEALGKRLIVEVRDAAWARVVASPRYGPPAMLP